MHEKDKHEKHGLRGNTQEPSNFTKKSMFFVY